MAKNLIRKSNSANQGRSFTSVQMVHTHAPLPRGFFGRRTNVAGCGSWIPNSSWWIHRCWTVSTWLWQQQSGLQRLVDSQCWTVSWWLWHHVGVESPTAVGGFTGAGLLAGGCGIVVSAVGVESPTAVGGFTGAGPLAGGTVVASCGSWIPNSSWWIHRCWTVSWWLWHQQSELQQLVDSQVLDC